MPDTLGTHSLQFTDMKLWQMKSATGKSNASHKVRKLDWFRLEVGLLVDTPNLVVVPQMMERKPELFVNFR
jgi:hypothetical protein